MLCAMTGRVVEKPQPSKIRPGGSPDMLDT